jgi:hypothetical protein
MVEASLVVTRPRRNATLIAPHALTVRPLCCKPHYTSVSELYSPDNLKYKVYQVSDIGTVYDESSQG